MSEARRVRFDPHVHTAVSYDARGSVCEVLDAAEGRGLDAVAITDHDTVAGTQRALDIQDRYDLLVVPGVEISTADGHLLGLGITAEPPVGESLTTTIEWVRARGGLAVVPHPFQWLRHGVSQRRLDDCDGIEVHNAWAVTGIQNRRAAAFAEREGYPGLGSSDAHRPELVGTAYTELAVEGSLRVDSLLDAVSQGQCRAVGESGTLGSSLRSYAGSLQQFITPTGAKGI